MSQLQVRVCGELVLKLRQASDTALGIDYAIGRSGDLQPSVAVSRLFHWVCHRPTRNGSAGCCRNP